MSPPKTSRPSTPSNPWTRPAISTWPMIGSCLLHLLLIGGLWWGIATRSAGTIKQPTASVGIAVAYRLPNRTQYITSESTEQSDASENAANEANASAASTAAAASAPPAGMVPPVDLDGLFAEMTGRGRGATAGEDAGVDGTVRFANGQSADQLGDADLVPGRSRAGQGAGQTTTSVFGVSGSGSTFVYVFDHSESMSVAGGKPLRAAKEELIRSLQSLTERQQFQIIFYNDTPKSFSTDGQLTGLVLGETNTLELARQFVERTVAIGGTEHQPALRMALRLAPDVIFFLTDAKIQTMSADQMADIRRRAGEAGTVIHAIQFGTGPEPTNSFMKEIARQNRGGYRYLDVTGP